MNTGYDLFVRRWAWLFPLTFIFHIVEEYYGKLHQWIASVFWTEPTLSQVLDMNILLWILMTAGIAAAMLFQAYRWLVLAFAVAVIINALAHLVGSIVTTSYSPGVISGTIFWLPLGGYALHQAYKYLERTRFVLGVLIGIFFHSIMLVSLLKAGTGPPW